MPRAGWRNPLLLLGAVGLVASCAAVGLTAAKSGVASPQPGAAFLANDIAKAAASRPLTLAREGGALSDVPSPGSPALPRPPCKADMVLVERTCVDRFEAHLLQAEPDGSLTLHPPHQRPDQGRYVAACSAGTKPQAYISQVEAAEACANAGKRLCSLREWRRACIGAQGRKYPYGARYEKGRCNVGKKHLLSMLHGADPSRWGYQHFNDPELDKTEGFLALTGEYSGCTTPEGVADLVGNLHEWVADRVDSTLAEKLPLPAVLERRIGRHTGNGIFMGGFFSTLNQHGEGCDFTTAAHDPRYHDYSTGFRCCADAAP